MDSRSETLRIVYIEDDPTIAQMYRMKLEKDGYRVTLAADGEAGLRAVREIHPDLVFLDIRLPKMDGFTVLRQLRDDPATRHIPVVILSNYSAAEMVETGIRLGAQDYVIKSEVTPGFVSDKVQHWASLSPPLV
ncbi:MAG TPA: response regulator [Candidatus Dormibacteraeota bacterium]